MDNRTGGQYYIYLAELPRLEHMVLEARDYHQRLMSRECEHEKQRSTGFPPSPEILKENRTTVFLDIFPEAKYEFSLTDRNGLYNVCKDVRIIV